MKYVCSDLTPTTMVWNSTHFMNSSFGQLRFAFALGELTFEQAVSRCLNGFSWHNFWGSCRHFTSRCSLLQFQPLANELVRRTASVSIDLHIGRFVGPLTRVSCKPAEVFVPFDSSGCTFSGATN